MMRITTPIHRYLQGRTSTEGRIDGRIFVIIALILYFTGLWLVNFVVPYYKAWDKIGVPAGVVLFGDLNIVLAAFECVRQGYDVLYESRCDLANNLGSLPYPHLWMLLAGTGLSRYNVVVAGVILVLSFYGVALAIAGRINKHESFIYILILCSPTIMLLVERGNVDIIVFDMLFLISLVIASKQAIFRYVGYLLILVPSSLKLLPIFSLGVIFKENNPRKALFIGALITTLFIVYCVFIHDEIEAIRQGAPYSFFHSSGAIVLPREFYARITALSESSLNIKSMKNVVVLFVTTGITIALLRLAAIQLGIFLRWAGRLPPDYIHPSSETGTWRLDAFRIGGCIYLGTFLSAVVFDYKLVFLLFAIPQLLFWIKYDRRLGPSASMGLIGIIAMLYAGALLYKWLVDEIINWGVAGYLVYALSMTLPPWAKARLVGLIRAVGLARSPSQRPG